MDKVQTSINPPKLPIIYDNDTVDDLEGLDHDFCYACEGVIQYAQGEFKKFWDMLDLDKPYECKQALLAYVPLLAKQCAGAGCALAGYYVNQKAIDELEKPERVQVETYFDEEKFTKSIDYFCRRLFDKK